VPRSAPPLGRNVPVPRGLFSGGAVPARTARTEVLQGPPGAMEIGDSRPFSPPGGSPKSQRGERGNLSEFGHLGLPGGGGPWAILACRGCRLGEIGRSKDRGAAGERGGGGGLPRPPIRWPTGYYGQARRRFLSRWSSVRMLLSPRPWCTRRSSVQCAELAVTAACAPG
jgi:hypothetical protein